MLFSWANKQLERLSETLAPPPTDANGQTSASHRFIAALASGNDDGAALALAILRGQEEENTSNNNNSAGAVLLDPATPLNVRGMSALHLAAKHGAPSLLQELIQVRGVNVNSVDRDGNTALHHAAIGNNNSNNNTAGRTNPLATVQILVESYGANVLSRNNMGETPYDVAINSQAVRGYLLPRQLQAETAIMTEAENNHILPPPPPTMMGSPPPQIMMGSPTMMQQQQHYHYGANTNSGVSGGGGGQDAAFDPVAALMQPTAGAVTRLRHNNTPSFHIQHQQQQNQFHHQEQFQQQQQQLQSPRQQCQVAPGVGMVSEQQHQSLQEQYSSADATKADEFDESLSSSLQDITLTPKCEAIAPSVADEDKMNNASANKLFDDVPVGQYQQHQQHLISPTNNSTSTLHMTTLPPPPPPYVSVIETRDTIKSVDDGQASILAPPPLTDATTATNANTFMQQHSHQTEPSTTEISTQQLEEQPKQSSPSPFRAIPTHLLPSTNNQSQPQPSAAPSSANSTNSSTTSSTSGYALRGGHANAAAAVLLCSSSSSYSDGGAGSGSGASRNVTARRIYKPDGFHSSSNDRELQAKYGHVTNEFEQRRYLAVGPPPKSGGSVATTSSDGGNAGGMGVPAAAAAPLLMQSPVSGGGGGGYNNNNPFSASGSSINTRVRYPTYSPASSSSGGVASIHSTTYSAPSAYGSGYNASNQANAVPTYATFHPHVASQQQQQFSPPPSASHQHTQHKQQ